VSKPTLLIVDDNEEFLAALKRSLRPEYDIRAARSKEEAATLLSPPPNLALLDLRLVEEDSTNRDGVALLQHILRQYSQVPVLMMTAYADIDTAVECLKLGAVDFIQKGRSDIREIKARLSSALKQAQLSRRVTELEHELHLIEPRKIVGGSGKILEVKRLIEVVARDGEVTVLIRGETGTGKELVAHAIHASGRRRHYPFVAVALPTIPAAVVESEMFGHEAGAFTDARRRHVGYLEQAHNGIIFLDEIGDLALESQVKFLRFLEEREFRRVGGSRPIRVDVQIVAATNSDLEAKVRAGQFREDLYYRLKVQEITLPPLREHTEDIPQLVEHYLHLARQRGKKVNQIAPTALHGLKKSPWPGNVRQLKNTIESAIFRAELNAHDQIEVDDLPPDISSINPSSKNDDSHLFSPDAANFTIQEALARAELFYIEKVLQMTKGRKSEAWKILGYNDRYSLYRRVRRIAEQYPHAVSEFPLVKKSLAGRT
jgi:DNA-binding NtrC family response regulator